MHAADATATARRVPVLLPYPLAGPYDYLIPNGAEAPPGTFVVAPLGPRLVPGVVWDGAPGAVGAERLRAIDDVLDAPPLHDELRRLIDWVAAYTLSPQGAVLRMAMSVGEALEKPRPTRAVAISDSGRAALEGGDSGKALSPARRRVLEELAAGPPR